MRLNLSRPLPAVADLHRPCLFWRPGGGEAGWERGVGIEGQWETPDE